MRWPFVLRSTVELLKTQTDSSYRAAIQRAERADRRAERAEEARCAAESRYADLVQAMVGLKKDGFGVREPAQQVPESPAPKLPPQILINAARRVSPVKDKTLEYNMELIYAREDAWGDDAECRALAEQIERGSVTE
jgi:hypothetical protein